MTDKQKRFRVQLLKMVHTNEMYKNLKRVEAWEDFLYVRFRVESSSELSIDELKVLVDVLNGGEDKLGLEADNVGRAMLKDKPNMITTKQILSIESLWEQKARDKTPKALRNFIKIVTKTFPLHLNTLTKAEATKVITALGRLR